MTPREIGDFLGQPIEVQPAGSGSGYGMMTLEQFCASLGIDPQPIIDHMASRGRTVNRTSTLRELASDIGITPHELQARIRQNAN